MSAVRTRARVEGTVQGVGFRPFVYRVAHEQGLAGYVLNDEHGVLLEVEGEPESVRRFFARVRAEAPPLASVDAVRCETVNPVGEPEFTIRASERTGPPDALIVPDSATCADCLAELADPADRRHRYPFINCTNCGPRFTIVRDVPYDRPLTTMAPFDMCAACRREYEDPRDRRFHAQPNACPVCGPHVRLLDAGGAEIGTGDPAAATAARLAAGAIVAVKGLGGYHLVCDAANERAVAALRARKHREDKPFALMVSDATAAAELIEVSAQARALLESPARPIVLARRRPQAAVANAVAPGAPELGVMLPYTPLHHLLVGDFGPGRAGDDQRQRLRRADRVSRRGRAGPAGHDRRRVPRPRSPDRDAHRRLGGARRPGDAAPLARVCPGAAAPAGGDGTTAAGVRRRAEEHLLRGQG